MATAKNSKDVVSVVASGAAIGKDCTHISLWNHATASAATNLLAYFQIFNDPDAIADGEQFKIAANGVTLTYTPGTGETEVLAKAALAGVVSGGVWVQLHEDDPGSNGTANIIGVVGRLSIPQADWTIA